MTQVFQSVREWQEFSQGLSQARNQTLGGKSLGFIPTMGALHEGHLSLMKRSLAENDLTVVSIYVNPTQFNDPSDLTNYPRMPEKDLEMIRSQGVHYLFMPLPTLEKNDLYPDQYRYRVVENKESQVLCGSSRPGHFDGVLTVVLKLLNLIRPTRAYFGEKDFQQLALIQGMVDAFFIPTKIIGCPTFRESDGLAMSSRNMRLNSEQRTLASVFPKILKEAPTPEIAVRQLQEQGLVVDYIEERFQRRLGAVHVGPVRLIDNVPAPTSC